MSQNELHVLKNAYDNVKALQSMNQALYERAKHEMNEDPRLDISEIVPHLIKIDHILATESEEIAEAYERVQTGKSNAQQQPAEDSFTALFGDLIANLENRADLFGNGNALTVTITQQTPEGDRSQSVTIG